MDGEEFKAQATQKYLRKSPRKVRLLVDAIRGENVADALTKLKFMNKSASKPVAKVIKSATANMRDKFQEERFDDEEISIKEIVVNEGQTLKRMQPRAMGRANIINKRTCHIHVEVAKEQLIY